MPELPEVETVRRGLASLVKGYKISAAHDLHPRALKPESIAPLKSIQGAKIIDLSRRGKFLWFVLDRPPVLVAHLGMSGQFLIHQEGHPKAKHGRAKFDLTKQLRKRELVFNAQRTFGWVSVEETEDGVPSSAQHIARDPFDPKFDREETINKFAKRNIRVKTALLNQEIMSGVGNIYADETLWRAKIHPEISTADLSKKKIGSLI
ncbi:MAG: DNA-formamidopyrimidine glycosylase, partial [Actinobacteria bacterium]|nr:DNA-formamidopyrimidine glycosylase [Actinomycetota bacterium]